MLSDNPAARLLAILEEGNRRKPEERCEKIWADLLGTGNNKSLLMSRLGKVMSLPGEIIEVLEREFPNQGDSHRHWSNQVNKGFMEQNLHAKWESFRSCIDQHTLNYLKLTADLLQGKTNSTLLEPATIEEVRENINSVLSEVVESELSDDVRTYLVRALQRILVAIDEYRITGATPILEAMEVTLGHAFSDPEYRTALLETEMGQTVVNVLSAVASSITIAVGLPQLPETFKFLLGAPPS